MATLQELQELRTRRLQEPPIPQVQATNPKAPDTTPKLPNEIVTNPEDTQAGMSEPKMSDYQFNQNFYREYMQKPVTQEEEDRRKRAAQSAQAIAGLDIPKETISEALGHEMGSPITSIYIKFDQRKVDEANRRVIDYVSGK